MTPNSERNPERVSCKVALYNPDRSKVLLTEYLPGDYGLPGGHTEAHETPEETMRRELREELGIADELALERRDFWRHSDGKIVLGFVGEVSEDVALSIDENEIRAAVWTGVSDIKAGHITAREYDEFILKHARL